MDRSPYRNANFAKDPSRIQKNLYIYIDNTLTYEIVNIIILIKVKNYFEIIHWTTDGIVSFYNTGVNVNYIKLMAAGVYLNDVVFETCFQLGYLRVVKCWICYSYFVSRTCEDWSPFSTHEVCSI